MLSDADEAERAILGAIRYSPNTIYLHRDPALMPKRRRAWASWNFLRWPWLSWMTTPCDVRSIDVTAQPNLM